MVKRYLEQLKLLIKRLLICYLVYFICRLLFFVVNKNLFPDVGALDFLKLSFFGLRFDTFSILVANSLFVLLSILPFKFTYHSAFQKFLFWLFLLINSIFISSNCIDMVYYRFTKKRSSADLFDQIGGQTDLGKLLPQFMLDFWWVFLFFAFMIWLITRLYKKIAVPRFEVSEPHKLKTTILLCLIFVFAGGLTVLGIRGGFQRVPIDIIDAGSVSGPEEVAIVLNTPFTLIKSSSQQSLKEYFFYDEKTLKQLYNPVHQYKDTSQGHLNVVVLILESFSKEYTKFGKGKSLTPFLDSLMDKSLTFTNAFSNGNKSIEGIPAILAGFPTLMENPLINSVYANNKQSSFANLLEKEGYFSAFFHGGINGTMNFDAWAKLAGYQAYYGRNEYNEEEDFDGFWGIWDEPFLKYSVKTMSTFKEPFHSAIFTLSSHHPFFVPEKYKNRFPTTGLENSESIGYADFALRQFFIEAAKTTWFKNTLFILTADHCSLSEDPFYRNTIGNLCIPILFYKADNSLMAKNNSLFSQIDILPTALKLIGFREPFFAFGESYTDKKMNLTYYYSNSNQYLINDSVAFQFNQDKLSSVFNFKRDSNLNQNLLLKYPQLEARIDSEYKAFMQTYHYTLIHNTGQVK